MSDMTVDLFAEVAFGKAALAKLVPVDPNFRLYCAGHADAKGTMRVTGAIFAHGKRGMYKGVLSVLIKGTEQTVYVTRSEIDAHEQP